MCEAFREKEGWVRKVEELKACVKRAPELTL